MPVYIQELFINFIKFIVIMAILTLSGTFMYLIMGLVEIIRFKKERVDYFTKKSVRIIMLLITISLTIQIMYFHTNRLNFDGYDCSDILIRYDNRSWDLTTEEEKDKILELLSDRKTNRSLLEVGSSYDNDTIFMDFFIFKENDHKPVHLVIGKNLAMIYKSGNTSFINKFSKEERDLHKAILEQIKSYP